MATTDMPARVDARGRGHALDEGSIRLRQRVGAAMLVLAPFGLAVSVAAYAWATRHGGDDYTGEGALQLARQHPGLGLTAVVSAMAGALLMVPAVLTAMRLLRPRSPRLSLVGGSMMVLGYACYVAIVSSGTTVLAMVKQGGDMADYAAVLDRSDGTLATSWVFVLFVAGNILGTLLLAIAVLRTRVVGRWAGVALLCWPVSHVVGLSLGSEWFELGGSLLQLAGFTALAAAVLRVPVHRWDTAV